MPQLEIEGSVQWSNQLQKSSNFFTCSEQNINHELISFVIVDFALSQTFSTDRKHAALLLFLYTLSITVAWFALSSGLQC